MKSGAKCETAVHGCDLFPTFCAVAGIDLASQERDGVSLLPLLDNVSAKIERPQPLVWHFPYYHPEKRFDASPFEIGIADFATSQTRPHSSVRSGRWKLLWFHEDDRCELYDLAKDLSERVDLADERRDVRDRLRAQLTNYLGHVHARLPTGGSPTR